MDQIIQLVQVINNGLPCTCYINTPFGNPMVMITQGQSRYGLDVDSEGRVIRYRDNHIVGEGNEIERELIELIRDMRHTMVTVSELSTSEWLERICEYNPTITTD